eukprot:12964378-Ditylum_brightwellii.AAC.1
MWFVWPAVSDEFKASMGLGGSPKKEAERLQNEIKEKEAAMVAYPIVTSQAPKRTITEKFKLDMTAKREIEKLAQKREHAAKSGFLEPTGEHTTEQDKFMMPLTKPRKDEEDDNNIRGA